MDNSVQLMNINKIYGETIKTQVLYDINVSFKKESFNSIIGASGSGKSTILNMIGTLDRPTSGSVIIEGRNTDEMSSDELAELRNETLGFIFQFHYLIPEFSVKENILMPYLIKSGKTNKTILKRADELIELMGLEKLQNNMANNISGGQQQRVAIARALINSPEIILADEPTGNLDSQATESVYKTLREINYLYKTTFIIITHDKRIAEKADRIIEIEDGRILRDVNVPGLVDEKRCSCEDILNKEHVL